MPLICSNKECSPLAPFIGTQLKYKFVDSKRDVKCRKCKATFYKPELEVDECPKCKIKFVPVKVRITYCPKCGRNY